MEWTIRLLLLLLLLLLSVICWYSVSKDWKHVLIAKLHTNFPPPPPPDRGCVHEAPSLVVLMLWFWISNHRTSVFLCSFYIQMLNVFYNIDELKPTVLLIATCSLYVENFPNRCLLVPHDPLFLMLIESRVNVSDLPVWSNPFRLN